MLLKPWNLFSGSYYLDQMSDDEDDSIANRPGPSVCILYSNLCLTIPRNMLIFNMVKMRYRCVDITGMGRNVYELQLYPRIEYTCTCPNTTKYQVINNKGNTKFVHLSMKLALR